MITRIPPELEEICQRLTQRWIRSRMGLKDQMEGCATILAAFWTALDPLIGSVGVKAIMGRVVYLVQQTHPQLDRILTQEGRLDVARLQESLRRQAEYDPTEVLEALVKEIFSVNFSLFGKATVAVLKEVQAGLANQQSVEPAEEGE